MFGVLLDALRQTAQCSGLLDTCDATGYSVQRLPTADGAFAVTSTAPPAFRRQELRELAATLHADGYRVHMCHEASEPLLLVKSGPPQS